MATTSSASFFERATGSPAKPLLVLRIFALATLAVFLLAMFVFRSGNPHGFCIGIATGLLIGLTVQLFSLRSVECNDTTRPADVADLRLTR